MRGCDGCKWEDSVTEIESPCDECSRLTDEACACHIHPPCSACVNDKFEESEGK